MSAPSGKVTLPPLCHHAFHTRAPQASKVGKVGTQLSMEGLSFPPLEQQSASLSGLLPSSPACL